MHYTAFGTCGCFTQIACPYLFGLEQPAIPRTTWEVAKAQCNFGWVVGYMKQAVSCLSRLVISINLTLEPFILKYPLFIYLYQTN
jgi:hypothetical protein